MSMTVYEGKLTSTNRWPESEKDFSNHKVQKHLYDILQDLAVGNGQLSCTDGEIWIHGKDGWIRIAANGFFELGCPGM